MNYVPKPYETTASDLMTFVFVAVVALLIAAHHYWETHDRR
jgi:hypothetical protein